MWATIIAAFGIVSWSFWFGGSPLFGWACLMVNPILLESYERHRIAGTDRGIELRTIWWRELVGWSELTSLETRPGYWPKDILLTQRKDPPWQVVITTSRGKVVVSTRRSIAEAMRADFERIRASRMGTDATES